MVATPAMVSSKANNLVADENTAGPMATCVAIQQSSEHVLLYTLLVVAIFPVPSVHNYGALPYSMILVFVN